MTRVAIPKPRVLTPDDVERIRQLYAESDRILDELFDHPGAYNPARAARLNEIDITIAGITGERILIDNINETL